MADWRQKAAERAAGGELAMDWNAACEAAGELARTWAADEPGGVILLFDRDGRRASRCGGLASLEHADPFRSETPCRWASITKHLFATLVIGREGGLDLGEPLGRVLDDLPPALAEVPIGRALDMTGGLPDVVETLWLLGVPFTAGLDREAVGRFARSLDGLNFPAGTEISYSNTGYRLAEEALRRRGIGVMEALRRRFGPLVAGMRLPEDWSEPVPGLATGYMRTAAGWRRCHYGLHASASGGLVGSADDLAGWLAALLRGDGPVSGLLAALSAPRRLADGRTTDYGLGLRWSMLGDTRLIGHGALLPGFCGHVLMDPASGTGVVVLSNRADTDPYGLATAVIGAGLGVRRPAPATHLPRGLFVDAAGSGVWLDSEAGQVSVLGTAVPFADAGGGWAESGAAQLPVRLRAEGQGLVGSVAHRDRRFEPVPPDALFGRSHDGLWHCPDLNAWARLGPEGLDIGAGPLRTVHPLLALGPDQAIFSTVHGPWRLRGCVTVEAGILRLVSERSRVLRFQRVA